MEKENNTDKRGFASMDPEKQREIAHKEGEASHGETTAKTGNIKQNDEEHK